MKNISFRTVQKGETHRGVIKFMGRQYEPTAAPTFIDPGQKVEIQVIDNPRPCAKIRVRRADGNHWAWEVWEEV